MASYCYFCNEEIWFTKDFFYVDGTLRPLDFEKDKNGYVKEHECIEKIKRQNTDCYNCGRTIMFSKMKVSKRGKMIPCEIDVKTGYLRPHDCPKNPWKKYEERTRKMCVTTTHGDSEVIKIPESFEDKHSKYLDQVYKFRQDWK